MRDLAPRPSFLSQPKSSPPAAAVLLFVLAAIVLAVAWLCVERRWV